MRLDLGASRSELIPKLATLGAGLVALGLDGVEIGQPPLIRVD